MLFTSHFLAAGMVGEYIGNPFLAFLVGFILHLFLDITPHYDTPVKGSFFNYRELLLVGTDFLIGVVILSFYFKSRGGLPVSFWSGALGGITIDIFDSNPFLVNWFRKFEFGKWVHKIHAKYHTDTNFLFGILTQIVVIFISCFFIFKY